MRAPEHQDIDDLLTMPKVDLHLHLVGAARPHTVAELARRHPRAGVPLSVDELADFYRFRGFDHFLDVYSTVNSLVRTPEDILTLAVGLGEDLRAQNVVYAEVTVTPLAHARVGLHPAQLADALDEGVRQVLERHDVHVAWIYDICAGDGPSAAEATVRAALEHAPAQLVGLGLGGAEAGVDRADFASAFRVARRAGLGSVPHAGEIAGPDQVWSAVRDLGAVRIGHGITAARDPALVRHLVAHRVALEVCLSSNLATGAVPSLASHPLPALLDAGVAVTLGSDDPPMFATSLLREYHLARDVLGLTRAQLVGIVRTGVDVSFAPESLKAHLRSQLALASR